MITNPDAAATPTPARGRAANIGFWTLQILLAIAYTFSGVLKVSADPQNVAGFTAMGLGLVGMYAVGTLELAGAIALLIPRLAGLAALCFVALMVGAVILTAVFAGVGLAVIPAVVGLAVGMVAWGRRDSTAALVARIRG